MYIKEYTDRLLTPIRYALKDNTLEFEMRIKESLNESITSEMFYNVMKRIKGIPTVDFIEEVDSLDIFLEEYDNIRVTIYGNENITKYCQTNDIKNIDKKYIEMIKKTIVRNVDVNDYKIRFSLKREEFLDTNTTLREIMKTWTSLKKMFRYKKRFVYRSQDSLFQYDLTLVKTSTKKTIRAANSFMKKKQIKDHMKKYIVKPDYVVDLDSWFDGIGEDEDVEMIGRKKTSYIYTKNMQKSNVLENPLDYEIELEFIGNKLNAKLDERKVLINMLQYTSVILQSVQKSYYIISEPEKRNVIDQYKKIMKDYKFRGPQNVTLELKHVIEKKYKDYQNGVSIRKGYSVTEKADGERNLLIILEDGSFYLMNRRNTVKKLNCKCEVLKNSILDCEYLIKDKEGNNINLLMLFDIYFYNNIDVRNRYLYRSQEEMREGKIEISRYEYLSEVSDIIDKQLQVDDSNNIIINKKKFYFGDDSDYDNKINEEIEKLEAMMIELEEEDPKIEEIKNQITEYRSDTQIFKEANKLYSKEYIYHIDGLIFTPRKLGAGENPENPKRDNFDGRWNVSFKWKPPEENTIDFLVSVKKDPENEQNDLVSYMTVNGEVIPYKTLILMVGYNPVIHTKHNSVRVLNEKLTFDERYYPVVFQPTEPYIKDIHYAQIPIKNDTIYCEDDNIIIDNCIVECKYDKNDTNFPWKPLRLRDNLKPNDFITANNVWNSIHNPVTTQMIKSGNIDIDYESNIYYHSTERRSSKKTKPMNDFHSYIKKKIITENCLGDRNIIDLCVGKGGDINHWMDTKPNIIVGLDINKDNLSNVNNGVCNRILSKYSENPEANAYLLNSLMIWADTSKNMSNSEAGKDDLNKYYLDVIYGNIPKESITNGKMRQLYNICNVEENMGFDLVSCQFAIHYFFGNKIDLETFLRNVTSVLKPRGRFVGTCFNGSYVFEQLKYNNMIEDRSNECWKIIKKYKKNVFNADESSLGYEIDVYNESIGHVFSEYLVNFEYLISMCAKYNLRLVESVDFKNVFDEVSSVSYGDIKSMTPELKTLSFLNTYFVFEKIE